ncbi:unnamed protein product [Symbiodinium microadriaticum]|nr:unnamed protein product [Symbiodinium microadriaticum]
MAKPYKFLLWERKHIYPLIIRGYQADVHDDLSSVGGGSDHLGNSYHGGDDIGDHGHGANGHGEAPAATTASEVAPTFEDDDEENGDGIQLAKGYSSSSGPLNSSSLVHVERDSLW